VYGLSVAADLLLFGVLLTMGLYHLVLYVLRRKDASPFWFGLFCLVIAVRTLLYGERFAFQLFPGLPWEAFQIADHLSFYLGIPLFAEFLRLVFVKDMSLWVIRIYQTLGILFAGFLFFPPSVFNLTVVGYELVSAVALAYLITVVGVALVRGRDGARITVIGVVLFLVCATNEIFYNLGLIHTFNSLSLGLVLFLFSQAVLLAIRFSRSFTEAERLSGQLLDTNKALRRFIPEEFFQLLNAREVTDIRLGDQVQKTMTVMFADIRSFTTLAETMSSEQTFHFLNSYYGRAGIVMRQHGGFIDKYFGDGFMTLFANRPDDALAAAVDLQKTVVEYNVHRATSGYPPIAVGTGLHYGPLVLGTIGEWDRMDTTVISDAVNLASRLEGLTKIYGKGTIVTVSFLDALEDPDRFHWRYLGLLRVQGRREPVEAVHVYDGVPQAEWDAFHLGKPAFEEALALYRQGAFAEAQIAFTNLALRYPEDPACGVYLTRISLMIKAGLTQDWDGVDTILGK
jgi:class 3 adenylate cyclase